MKISKRLLAVSALLLLGLTHAGITMDRTHTHSSAFTKKTKTKMHSTEASAPLIVHVVPHTHDDVGWLKTPDEYFSGTKYLIQRADVELILESMIRELIKDPKKRFSYVEMKFFSLWFYEQTESMKTEIRKLVQ